VLTLTKAVSVPRVHRIMVRSKQQWDLWLELQKAIDDAPSITPCTNFPDLFFGDSAIGAAQADNRMAKELCQKCPIINDCLTYALEAKEEWGVWGGMTYQERKRLRRSNGSTRKTAKTV
jgi:WhiB family redox-sensing transcriptional regulator